MGESPLSKSVHEVSKMKENLQTKFSTRQYMRSKDFEIYYYKGFYPSNVESHTHTHYEIYFFLEGDVSIEIKGNAYPLEYGDVVVIPPGVAHRALVHGEEVPYRRFVLWITCDYLNSLMGVSQAYGYLMQSAQTGRGHVFHNDRIACNAIQAKAFRLIEEIHSNRFGKEAKVPLCMNDLLLHVNRTAYERKHEKSVWEQQNLCEGLKDYIEDHLEEVLSLDVLAQTFFVSKYYIVHVFKENMGIPLHQYIRKKRLEACKGAIRSGAKISEAYLTFGFKEYSSFYRAFKLEYGMSPKEWQETVSGKKL